MGNQDPVQRSGRDSDHLVGKNALLEESSKHPDLGSTTYRASRENEHRVRWWPRTAKSPKEAGK